MRRMFFIAVGLVVMAGLLGVSKAGANHQPPKGQTVTITVRGNATVTVRFGQPSGRPAKPYYGTLTLQLKTLGLDPARQICANVFYTGQLSGYNTICNVVSRWIWAKRGSFLTASFHITSPLPVGCRLPAPISPPHLTQRVNLTFILDCRRAKPVTPVTPKQPKQGGVFATLNCVGGVQGGPFSVQATVNGIPQVAVGIGCNQRLQLAVAAKGTIVPVCFLAGGLPLLCKNAVAGVRGVVFTLAPPVAPALAEVWLHAVCSPGTPVGVVVYVNGFPRGPAETFICSTPKIVGSFPPGTVLQFCLQWPVGSTWSGGGPCITIRIDATGRVTLDLRVIFQIVVVTTTTTTPPPGTTTVVTVTTTTPTTTGGAPANPNP